MAKEINFQWNDLDSIKLKKFNSPTKMMWERETEGKAMIHLYSVQKDRGDTKKLLPINISQTTISLLE